MNKNYFNGLELLGSQDVQHILNVSRSFIQRIVDEKLIPAQRTSAGWIFPKEAVLEFQKQRELKAKTDRRVHINR